MVVFNEISALTRGIFYGGCKAPSAMENGYIVTVDRSSDTAALPTSTTAKGDIWMVVNEPDAVVDNSGDFAIAKDEYIRCVNVNSLTGNCIKCDLSAVATAYASLFANDLLVANTSGKLEKCADASSYVNWFLVKKKITIDGKDALLLEVNG